MTLQSRSKLQRPGTRAGHGQLRPLMKMLLREIGMQPGGLLDILKASYGLQASMDDSYLSGWLCTNASLQCEDGGRGRGRTPL